MNSYGVPMEFIKQVRVIYKDFPRQLSISLGTVFSGFPYRKIWNNSGKMIYFRAAIEGMIPSECDVKQIETRDHIIFPHKKNINVYYTK